MRLTCCALYRPQPVKSAPWFTERPLTDFSVGGLIVLVLVRAVQYNMNNTRVSRLRNRQTLPAFVH